MENVIAVGLILPEVTKTTAEEHLEELVKLIGSAGANVVSTLLAKRPAPDAALYVGKGKAEEIRQLAVDNNAVLIVFDDDLTPAQVRNLEKLMGPQIRVIDRSGLILDIFDRRAKTREARTQVELAQMEYMLPRLKRAWSHLERQGGSSGTGGSGGGARRGVGETQLELDRRIVRTRIARLKEELQKIEKQRGTQRKARGAAFTVALVGYTNAGKSTMFNRLASGKAPAVDKLFATLDSKSQKIAAEMPRETVVIDTVGFIRKLPHHLVASFRSTMEEAVNADLVLHVIDASHPQHGEQREVGEQVLTDLGVDLANVIDVYNKIDRVDEHFDMRQRNSVVVSALTGQNIERLLDVIRERERAGGELLQLEIPHAESRLLAKLHEVAEVHNTRNNDEGVVVSAWVPNDAVHLFASHVIGRPSRERRAS
ncbi:MAG TPA: GTPase HflX [Thermoanaerobaculia bacterium]|jgi:GTP-binding protein HflX|nr:GTPase HflX [Thermoanaerobaculia bacterium]